jgi:hypothetical protein
MRRNLNDNVHKLFSKRARSTRVLQYCHFDNFVLLTSSRLDTYMSKRKLTKEMADAFVESIIIHGKYDYEIKLVYDDQFADLQKLKKEKEAQSR